MTLPLLPDDSSYQRLQKFNELVDGGRLLPTLVPLLPLIFKFQGAPFTLKNHFAFEPMFSTRVPAQSVYKAARQVGKTKSISARALAMAAILPWFKVLFCAPLLDQVQRISNDHVRPLIEESPFRSIWFDSKQIGSVMRRELRNRSTIYCTYAFLTAERIRGFSGINWCGLDEIQDINPDHLPVIQETMSGATGIGITQYTGTAKTRDNTLQSLWESSSQAEWIMKCQAIGCGHYNIPAAEFEGGEITKMIGPYRDDISEERPGLVCAKCQQPLQPRLGRWIPRYPDRTCDFVGYHIPQPIMPNHYSIPEKWRILIGKQNGYGGYNTGRFYNECLGEPYDFATKLINLPDLQKAAVLNENDEETALRAKAAYPLRVLAVDWGGGGEKGISRTAVAVLGMLPTGTIDVIYGRKLPNPHDHAGEAAECLRLYSIFQCEYMAHDYTGAGEVREAFMVHNGMPSESLMPIAYLGATRGNVMTYKPATIQHPREYWIVDKTRTLQLTCYSIKFGKIRFFADDWKSPQEPGILRDFLALIENKIPSARGSDVYTIQRDPSNPDDFAQAVNIGCCALWHTTQSWPDFFGMIQGGAETGDDD